MEESEQALLQQVHELVERERTLREHLADPHDRARITDRDALHHVEEELDQCWDLLRQRRALQAVHRDPDAAQVRPVVQVENYLPRPEGGR
ncbi:DUF2630 family protein [Streptomyces bobili]|uniref:DUF2630 family protein n=1 Tax=Streptomyces bobili TaxID=67280 RepID=UPI0037B90868